MSLTIDQGTKVTMSFSLSLENGEIVGPINTMRFDDSFYNYFGDNLLQVGNKTEFIPNTSTYGNREIGGTTCPGILADSVALTL